MPNLNESTFGSDLLDQPLVGGDSHTPFRRDGALDLLRHALTQRLMARKAWDQAGIDAPSPDRPEPNRGSEAAKEQVERLQIAQPDFVDRIVSLHARGHTMAEIQRGTSLLLGRTVSFAAIEAALAEVRRASGDWCTRALEPSYPVVVFERLRVKWRQGSVAQNRLCHFALGFQAHGPKEVLGLWLESGESVPFWSAVLSDLKERGVADILYIVGSSPQLNDAQACAFPASMAVTHVGDYVRRSLQLAISKDRAAVTRELRAIHGASNAAEALDHLSQFENSTLGQRYPGVGAIWRRGWAEVATFIEVPIEVRRVMTSTFAADSVRRGYKQKLRGDGHLSDVEGAAALMYLTVRDVQRKWKRPQREWHAAKTRLASMYPDRFGAA